MNKKFRKFVSRHCYADNWHWGKPSPVTTCHPLPEVEGNNSFAKQTATCHPELVSGSEVGEIKSTPLSNSLPRREDNYPLQGRGSSCASESELQMRERGEQNSFAKQTETVISPFTSHFSRKRTAFTLAEVLITLGIIGVVAALTMPSLITKYQQSVVETRVKKFYSEINNALRLSVVDNGDVEQWLPKLNRDATYEENVDLLNKYFLPYIKYTEQFECGFIDLACAKLPNGSSFGVRSDNGGTGIGFWVNGKFDTSTRNSFTFQLNGKSALAGPQGYIVPYIGTWWDGNYDTLKTHQRGCYKGTNVWGNFCTKLLQQNGWKITPDYPW